MKQITLALLAGSAFAMGGCATLNEAADDIGLSDETATATLRTADGTDVGTVTTMPMNGGIHVMVNAYNMPTGTHGAHIHTTGRCDAPDFSSAGGHWNPTNVPHGTMNDDGVAHAGDLPNLVIGADGSGSIDAMAPVGTFDAMLSGDGSAFIIHANADDGVSQPSGDAGSRIACGVLRRTDAI
ncbi:superoxide dismutase family protein [Croceicoccus hydrothermalis]|uniref:superoxide dismutase family protein n=1 Tax=Croceicoccus hydrothermalis TaxID=2867964 RepID=UPI001EFB5ADE|nr:superoxide dismutase family protein [Croceicoccus hydrothermalis]